MQNTQLLATQLQKHFLWLLLIWKTSNLPTIVFQNWPVQNGELTAYIETKQTSWQNSHVERQAREYCFPAIKRIEEAKLL